MPLVEAVRSLDAACCCHARCGALLGGDHGTWAGCLLGSGQTLGVWCRNSACLAGKARRRRCSWGLTHRTHCHVTVHCSLHHARAQRTAPPAEPQRADHSHPQRLPLCRAPLSSAQALSRGRLDVPCGDLDEVFVHRPSEREPPPPRYSCPATIWFQLQLSTVVLMSPVRGARGVPFRGPSALSLALGPPLYFVAQCARERVPLPPRCTIVRPRH